jgi:hypothetical protein
MDTSNYLKINLGTLWEVLRGENSLWHRTSVSSLQGILKEGIKFNDGTFSSTYPISNLSMGAYLKAVCLFDFSLYSEEDVLSQGLNWSPFLTDCGTPTIFIRILKSSLKLEKYIDQTMPEKFEVLITHSDGSEYYPTRLPFVESWYIGQIAPCNFVEILAVHKEQEIYHFENFNC